MAFRGHLSARSRFPSENRSDVFSIPFIHLPALLCLSLSVGKHSGIFRSSVRWRRCTLAFAYVNEHVIPGVVSFIFWVTFGASRGRDYWYTHLEDPECFQKSFSGKPMSGTELFTVDGIDESGAQWGHRRDRGKWRRVFSQRKRSVVIKVSATTLHANRPQIGCVRNLSRISKQWGTLSTRAILQRTLGITSRRFLQFQQSRAP